MVGEAVGARGASCRRVGRSLIIVRVAHTTGDRVSGFVRGRRCVCLPVSCQLCPRVSILIYFRDPLLSPNAFPRSPCPLKTDASPFVWSARKESANKLVLPRERTCVRGKTGALSFLRASSRCRASTKRRMSPGHHMAHCRRGMDGW